MRLPACAVHPGASLDPLWRYLPMKEYSALPPDSCAGAQAIPTWMVASDDCRRPPGRPAALFGFLAQDGKGRSVRSEDLRSFPAARLSAPSHDAGPLDFASRHRQSDRFTDLRRADPPGPNTGRSHRSHRRPLRRFEVLADIRSAHSEHDQRNSHRAFMAVQFPVDSGYPRTARHQDAHFDRPAPRGRGETGLASIMKQYHATTYLSGTGGRAYKGDCEEFHNAGIDIAWSTHQPVTGDSILSVLMDYDDPMAVVMSEQPVRVGNAIRQDLPTRAPSRG